MWGGGRKSMRRIQATVAMEKQQIRVDIIATAAGGTCFGTRSNAMSTHQDLIPEPHTRTSTVREFQKIVKEGPSMYRGSHKIFRQEHPMSIPEELVDKHQCRASSGY